MDLLHFVARHVSRSFIRVFRPPREYLLGGRSKIRAATKGEENRRLGQHGTSIGYDPQHGGNNQFWGPPGYQCRLLRVKRTGGRRESSRTSRRAGLSKIPSIQDRSRRSARMDQSELRVRIRLLVASGELPPAPPLVSESLLPATAVSRGSSSEKYGGLVSDLRRARPECLLHIRRSDGNSSARRLRCSLAARGDMKIRQLAAIGAGDGTCVAAALGCINRTRAPRDDANKGRSWGPSSGSRTVHCSN